MYCNKCGKEATETSTYCSNCGAKIGILNDSISEGMQFFDVNENEPIKNESRRDFIFKDWADFLLTLVINIFFFTLTYFTTPSLIKVYIGSFYSNDDPSH
jgi:uncharacterized membrane protein YvbJ